MDSVYARIATWAGRQYGLITQAQAYQAGLTWDGLRHLVATGRWVHVARGIYRINGTPLDWKGRVMGLSLAAGPQAVVSHRTAAALWCLDGFDPPRAVDLTVPRDRRPRVPARVHRSSDYDLVGRTLRQAIPVTGVARTVLDVCAATPNPQIAQRALLDARRQRLVTWAALWECHDLHTRPGRPGLRLYRRLLERHGGKEVPDTTFEALVQQVDAGLPEPEPRVWVTVGGRRYRLDLAYGAPRIDIECHSKEWHLNDAAFEADPLRDNALAVAGWLVLHFTWRRFRDDPAGIVSEVRAALACRDAAPRTAFASS